MRSNSAKTKLLLTSMTSMLVLSVTLIGATVVSAAKPTDTVAIDLDQCRNGALANPQTSVQQCVTTGSGSAGWVNGNAGASNAHFAEGESISYRARMSNLPADAQVTLTLGYDVIHNGHDAIDYLTDINRWQLPESSVGADPDDPCSGVSNCTDGFSPDDLIAIDTPVTNIQVNPNTTLASGNCQKTGAGATQQPATSFAAVAGAGQANMELFGGTDGDFEYVSTSIPTLLDKNGDQEQQVTVTFKATRSNPVLAWGGHIASRLDWGCTDSVRSASGISGSPYHMRIKSATVNGTAVSLGNQDRSLSASAVIFVAPTLTTTPGGSATYSATVTDRLNVGVANAGGTATFTLYPSLTDCQNKTNSVFSTTVSVTNGQTAAGAVTTTITGLTADATYYWFVHYSGDNSVNPAVGAADSSCSESVAFTAPTVTPAGS